MRDSSSGCFGALQFLAICRLKWRSLKWRTIFTDYCHLSYIKKRFVLTDGQNEGSDTSWSFFKYNGSNEFLQLQTHARNVYHM